MKFNELEDEVRENILKDLGKNDLKTSDYSIENIEGQEYSISELGIGSGGSKAKLFKITHYKNKEVAKEYFAKVYENHDEIRETRLADVVGIEVLSNLEHVVGIEGIYELKDNKGVVISPFVEGNNAKKEFQRPGLSKKKLDTFEKVAKGLLELYKNGIQI